MNNETEITNDELKDLKDYLEKMISGSSGSNFLPTAYIRSMIRIITELKFRRIGIARIK